MKSRAFIFGITRVARDRTSHIKYTSVIYHKSCCICMSHVSYERVWPHIFLKWHVEWIVSHVKEWVMNDTCRTWKPHMNASYCIWMSHVACPTWMRHVEYEWAVSQAAYQRVTSYMNVSCFTLRESRKMMKRPFNFGLSSYMRRDSCMQDMIHSHATWLMRRHALSTLLCTHASTVYTRHDVCIQNMAHSNEIWLIWRRHDSFALPWW